MQSAIMLNSTSQTRPSSCQFCFIQVAVPLQLSHRSARKSKTPQQCRKRHLHSRRSRIVSAEQSSSAGRPEEIRAELLNLVSTFGRSGGTSASSVREVEATVRALISSRGGGETPPLVANDLDPTDTSSWAERLQGRWDLRFSTEGPLLRLMTVGAYPLLATGAVYQVFRGDGTLQVSNASERLFEACMCRFLTSSDLQNVVEFDRDEVKGTLPAVMSVGVDYVPNEMERRCDFKFRRTRVMLGRSARASIYEAKGVLDGLSLTGGLNLDLDVPFAIGEGYFRVIWLDHALRIDRDTSNGKDWLNIYLYAGPADKCTAV